MEGEINVDRSDDHDCRLRAWLGVHMKAGELAPSHRDAMLLPRAWRGEQAVRDGVDMQVVIGARAS